MRTIRRVACGMIAVSLLTLTASAADWVNFRGPGGQGTSDEKNLPTTWGDTQNVIWKTEMPGFGSSSAVLQDGKIYLTYYSGYGLGQSNPGTIQALERHLVSVDRKTGKILWDKIEKAAQPESKYESYQALHGFASSTPVIEGDKLFTFFGRTGAFAFDLEGNQKWKQDVGSKTHGWGSGSSPVVYKNMVIVNAYVESASIVAMDKATGKVVWKAAVPDMAWNTPVLTEVEGHQELLLSCKNIIIALNPDDGKRLWNCKGINDYIVPSIVVHDGVAYSIGARAGTAIAVRCGGTGDVTATHKLWEVKLGSNVSSPVYHDGYLYWAHESRGEVYCVDAKTGQTKYQQRLRPASDRIYASAMLADGNIYYVSRNNGTYVVAAKPEFQLVSHNTFASDDSVFNSSPAVNDGQLFIRSDRYLYCIGKK